MILTVERKYKKSKYTIGNLFINGVWFCNTLEDRDRGLTQDMTEFQISGIKITNNTAIPLGTYQIDMNTVSPKFSKYPFYMEVCKGKVPRLINVPGFKGILIHVADGHKGADLVSGCIGVGYNRIKGGLLEGKRVFTELYRRLDEAVLRNEQIKIAIQ